jgi:hypothetical protein
MTVGQMFALHDDPYSNKNDCVGVQLLSAALIGYDVLSHLGIQFFEHGETSLSETLLDITTKGVRGDNQVGEVDTDEDSGPLEAHVAEGTGNSNKFDVRKSCDGKPLPKIDTRDRSSAEQQALYKKANDYPDCTNLKSVRAQVMKHVKDSTVCTYDPRTDILSGSILAAAAEARCI